MSLHVTDDYFLCGSHRTDDRFSVYSKNNISKITDLCKKGRGPGEFVCSSLFTLDVNSKTGRLKYGYWTEVTCHVSLN